MKFIKMQFLSILTILIFQFASVSAESAQQDNIHVRTWNAFANDILKLHNATIAGKEVRKLSKPGGYSGNKDFYIEEQYFLGENLVSIIQWEKQNPDTMHTIELFVYDDKGRVIRDFTAAYLPRYRNAPVQTLVSLHQYSKGLHGFRSFDASGYRVLERCSGTLKGKQFDMLLDEDDIANSIGDDTGIMASTEYLACFKGLPVEPGKYLKPQ